MQRISLTLLFIAGSTVNVVHVVNNERVSNLSLGSNGTNHSPLTVSFDEDFADQPLAVRSLLFICRRCFRAVVVSHDMWLWLSVMTLAPPCLQGYVERKVATAQDMIKDMYLPHLEAADVEFSVNVHVVDGQKSAAGIAEQVVQAATQAGSDLLAVTSHGGCVPPSNIGYCA